MAGNVLDLLETISTDTEALRNFKSDPPSFAANYDLSDDERDAVIAGDATKLRSLLSNNPIAAGTIVFVMVLDS